MERRGWGREELLKALQLYLLTPFGRIYWRNPQIQQLASEIGRTASAVAFKMANFASLDPTLEQRGMANASKLDREVWGEFFGQMTASLAAEAQTQTATGFAEEPRDFISGVTEFPAGTDICRSVKTRVNQDFFRRMVLASYDNKCALTGIEAPELLVASHIVPWAENTDVRTTPQNGICLNALHDRAFDEGYLTFSDNFEVIYSSHLPSIARQALRSFGSEKLRLPSKFIPDTSLLTFHREYVFRD